MPKLINESHRNTGLAIQMLRKKKNLTQRELADKLKISAVYMGYIEQGREKPASELLKKIFVVLEVPQEEG